MLKKYERSVFFLIVSAAFAIYGRGISIPYYLDDFQFVFEDPAAKIFFYFSHNNPLNNFYRPVQSSFLALTQALFGMNTVAIHSLSILLHSSLSCLVYSFLKRLGFSFAWSMLGALFMLVSQANVAAVMGVDTLSQVIGTAAGSVSLYLLYIFTEKSKLKIEGAPKSRRWLFYGLSLTLTAVALLSKETSIAFIGSAFFVCFVGFKHGKGRLGSTLMIWAPYLLIASLYLFLRSNTVAQRAVLGDSRYGYEFGANLIGNAILFAGGMLSPVSSVAVFSSIAREAAPKLILYVSTAAVFTLIVIAGIFRGERRGFSLSMIILALIALLPALPLNRVSELYLYNASPFFAPAVVAGIYGWASRNTDGPRQRYAALFVAAVLSLNLIAVESKLSLMKECGERARYLLREVSSYVHRAPPGGNVVLLSSDDMFEYSVFRISDFKVIRYSEHIIYRSTGRNDVGIIFRDMSEREEAEKEFPSAITLEIVGGRVSASMP